MSAGYSGTPLARKLSLKDGQRVWFSNMPASVRAEIEAAGLALVHLAAPEPPIDAAQVFVTRRTELEDAIATLRPRLAPAGFAWISWPKKASGVATDITEDEVRRVALPTGLVDIKVCAVDAVWSGLKLVIRKELR
jgi:hypothetical protein